MYKQERASTLLLEVLEVYMNTSTRIHPLLRVPPPLLFVLAFLAGVGLQHLLPLAPATTGLISAVQFIGKGLAIAGIALALCCLVMFLLSRTTLIPFGSAAQLVTHGPYRFTRNPMYLSLVLVYLGVAATLVQAWSLLLLPVPITVMHHIVIPYEEQRLRDLFGDAFDSYCASVRRWI